jgi:hypothetical protein
MKAYLITFIAALFAWWIINQQEEPLIWFNAAAAVACACMFILLCLGVMELCGCVM